MDEPELAGGSIDWRRLRPDDFALLGEWLAQPHVARWWNHETTPEAVARDFGPSYRREEPNEDLLMHCDGEPVGLVQRSLLADYPEYLAEFAAIVDVPVGAATIDYLIGDPDRVGRGLGARMVAAVVAQTWKAHPDTSAVLVAVAAANRRSWRMLEKAGARRVGTGDIKPDNPIDDWAHHVYRFDRP